MKYLLNAAKIWKPWHNSRPCLVHNRQGDSPSILSQEVHEPIHHETRFGSIKRIEVSNPSDHVVATCSTKRQTGTSSSESRIYTPDYQFCGKIKCYKGTSTREKVSKTADLRADKLLRDCAVHKCDTKITAVISRHIVAAEVQHHFSWYRNYRPSTKDAQHRNIDNKSEAGHIQEEAYEELLGFVQNKIIPNKEIPEYLNLIMISKGMHGITT